jgi:hypothetical protein
MSRGKILAGLITLFVAGVLCGIAGTSLYQTSEQEQRGERGAAAQHDRIMARLTQELALTSEQRADIEPIVTRAHVAILELRFTHQAEIESILIKGMADLNAKLSPEQQTRIEAMYARLQRRWTKSRDYLEATKRRLTWLAPFAPPSDGELLMHTHLGMDALDMVTAQAQWWDEREPLTAPRGGVVRISDTDDRAHREPHTIGSRRANAFGTRLCPPHTPRAREADR